MNPLTLLTTVAVAPVRVAGAVTGAGLRTSARVIGWMLEQATGPAPVRTPPPTWTPERAAPVVDEPSAPAPPPAKAPATKKAPAKKAAAKKAPTKKAAVLAPALGLTEAEVVAQDAGTDEV